MTSSSPAEFLTFMRRATSARMVRTVASAARPIPIVRAQFPTPRSAPRAFSCATSRQASGKPVAGSPAQDQKETDSERTQDEKNRMDVQGTESKKTAEARAKGEGGAAVDRSDSRDTTAKAKKDHPEAPDTVIGMQDERGGKGH